MKNLLTFLIPLLALAGCSVQPPAKDWYAVAYGLPVDCEIKELLALDPTYEAFDQTESGAKNSRDCLIGAPNSDVGIGVYYKNAQQPEWTYEVEHNLKADGYSKFEIGLPDVEAWRKQEGGEEEGTSCSIHAHVAGLSIYVVEAWATCDDKWNRELMRYVVNYAQSKF